MRHYKVKKKYHEQSDSSLFDRDSIEYNIADVELQEPIKLQTCKLYASDMKRAQLTARHAFGQEPEILNGVYEITMKSYKNTTKRKKTYYWEVRARLEWMFNRQSQYESKKDTYQRLNQALDLLEQRGEDATIVMHGMVMRHLSKILLKRGYSGTVAWRAENGECFQYVK